MKTDILEECLIRYGYVNKIKLCFNLAALCFLIRRTWVNNYRNDSYLLVYFYVLNVTSTLAVLVLGISYSWSD